MLLIAHKNNNIEMFKFILEQEKALEGERKDLTDLLKKSVSGNQLEMTEFLLDIEKSPESRNNLFKLVSKTNIDMFALLIKKGSTSIYLRKLGIIIKIILN